MKKEIHVGKVLDAHGIRGDIYCIVFSGDASWVSELATIRLGSEVFKINRIKEFKKGFIASLEGFTDRNRAESYKGKEVWVDEDLFVSEDGDALFLKEILGFEVNDKLLGRVGEITGFSSNGIQDLLVINNKIEIPFVKEFVLTMDFENKIIQTELPAGLLEINEPDEN
jgi:16S rRNA processing protein RimM